MTVFYNLADLGAGLKELLRRVDILETTDWGGFSSVDEGAFRILSDEGLIVVGSARIDGKLLGSGTLGWTGPTMLKGTTRFEGDTTQLGPFHVTGATDVTGNLTARGATKLEGPVEVTGTLAVKGVTTLTADLNVTTGGKIRAGNTFFNPDGTLSATTLLTIQGSAGISLAGTTTVGGSFLVPSITAGTGAANTYVDGVGKFWKASSASRFKIDPELMDVPDALLDVPVRAWIDKGNAERFAALYDAPRPFTQEQQIDYDGADLSRIPGVIAEEVKSAGGEAFVTYDAEGVIEGVAYDRLALARTQILAQKLDDMATRFDAAMELIAELQKKLAA